jgi:hypothetical protein
MSIRQIVPEVVAQFRQELVELVESAEGREFDALGFTQFIDGLKAVLASAGRETFVRIVGLQDESDDLFERDGTRYRFKQLSTKDWLTPFGVVQVDRRYFQPDAGGDGVAPIDLRCGMSGRFITPDVEEAVALASANLSPTSTRALLSKVLPHPPSAKAIRRTISRLGQWADDAQDEIEERVAREAPLPNGEVLVVSVDGVTVPLREPGCRTGRPAERPGVRSGDRTPTTWREAGVGTVSTYTPGDGDEDLPQRMGTKYLARMPESGMKTLFDEVGWVVSDLTSKRNFREMVVLCDGKPALWDNIAADPLYDGATQILDFFHAVEHLSRAAEAIFGKKESAATRWHAKYRALLLEDPDALDSVLRSLRYYRQKLRSGSERRRVVERVIRYYGRNRERMRYADFRARGLPIGSGVVEAACKCIVNSRLKRSGMRWTRDGGQHVLNLRVRVQSGEWDAFWNEYQDQQRRAA